MHVKAWNSKGHALMQQGKNVEGMMCLDKAVKIARETGKFSGLR
nr:tetratricopeptide repeat protein [Candidatus Freyarchaeota archaeon]